MASTCVVAQSVRLVRLALGCVKTAFLVCFFFFKQKTAYEIGTGDWSSDVCSSDLFARKSIGKHFFLAMIIVKACVKLV